MDSGYIDKKVVLIVVVIEILAVFLGIKDVMDSRNFVGELQRPGVGEVEVLKELSVETEEGKQEITVKVSPVNRTREEIEALFDGAEEEIRGSLAGDNEDLDNIIKDLNPKASYQNGVVTANWEFDRPELIDHGGKINLGEIHEPTLVEANCTLSCEESQRIYFCYIRLIPPDVSTKEGYEYLLNESLKEADEKDRSKEVMVLPETVGSRKLQWELPKSYRGIQLALFGFVAFVLVILSKKEQEKKDLKQRMRLLEVDYPEIVSMLSLYVGAGISVKSSVSRIAESYKKKLSEGGEERPGFDGICVLLRDMSDGKGEIESYKDFGKRMGQKDYRKLSILLVQNIRKGTAQLTEMLEKEEHTAFEERKLRAKIAGEEASTKLLLPMMGLLGIVLVVLIFPAMQGMNI